MSKRFWSFYLSFEFECINGIFRNLSYFQCAVERKINNSMNEYDAPNRTS